MTFTIDKSTWKIHTFDQIAVNVNDRIDVPAESGLERYVGLEHLTPGELRISRWADPTEAKAQKLHFLPGDVIFGRRRAYQRKVAQADFEGLCSAHALVLRAKPDVCIEEFLPHFIASDSFMKRAIGISVGSTSPTVNWKDLRHQEFLLPPIEEQHRIADLLWAVNNHLATLKSQALILEATNTRNGFGKWLAERFRNAETAKFSEIFQVSSGSFLPAKNFTDGQIPVYGGNGIAGYHGKSNTENHTIIIGRVGAYCGNVHKVEAPAWITDNALIVKIKKPELFVSLDYIALLLKVLGLNTYASQTAQPSLSGKTLAECRVPFLPIEEQFQIQEVLNFIQATKSAMEFEAQNLASFAMEIQFSIFGGSDVC